MKIFKVTKEELRKVYNNQPEEFDDTITLEGEPVKEETGVRFGCPRHGKEECDCSPHTQSIEEILFVFDAKKDFDAIMILKDKLNELIRAYNKR